MSVKASTAFSRVFLRYSAWLTFFGSCLAPANVVAQAAAEPEPPAASSTTEAAPPAGTEAPPEPVATPEPAPEPTPAPAAAPPPAPTPAPAPEASPKPASDDDPIGPGMHVVGMDVWFGLEPGQVSLKGESYKGLGAGLGIRTCLLCMLFGESRFAAGDLLGVDSGLGYQSPESGSLGNMWALLRIDVGLQVAARPLDDLEVVLRYYVISHLNTLRDVGSSDDVYVLEPGVRYRQFLLDVGFGAKPFRYPLLAEHGETASAFTLRGRYLLDLKKGYYAGASYEKLGGPGSEPYSSNVFRLMLGIQN